MLRRMVLVEKNVSAIVPCQPGISRNIITNRRRQFTEQTAVSEGCRSGGVTFFHPWTDEQTTEVLRNKGLVEPGSQNAFLPTFYNGLRAV